MRTKFKTSISSVESIWDEIYFLKAWWTKICLLYIFYLTTDLLSETQFWIYLCDKIFCLAILKQSIWNVTFSPSIHGQFSSLLSIWPFTIVPICICRNGILPLKPYILLFRQLLCWSPNYVTFHGNGSPLFGEEINLNLPISNSDQIRIPRIPTHNHRIQSWNGSSLLVPLSPRSFVQLGIKRALPCLSIVYSRHSFTISPAASQAESVSTHVASLHEMTSPVDQFYSPPKFGFVVVW